MTDFQPPVVHPPLRASEVIQRIQQQIDRLGDVAVHILDMEDDGENEHTWDGLVTHVEDDCLSGEQGLVVSLMAWRSMPPQGGAVPDD